MQLKLNKQGVILEANRLPRGSGGRPTLRLGLTGLQAWPHWNDWDNWCSMMRLGTPRTPGRG